MKRVRIFTDSYFWFCSNAQKKDKKIYQLVIHLVTVNVKVLRGPSIIGSYSNLSSRIGRIVIVIEIKILGFH